MNIITRASVKERIHVEQIIRSQPHMHNSHLVDIVMTQSQYDAVLQRFEEQYKKAYGVTVERDWKDSPFDCGENEEEEI